MVSGGARRGEEGQVLPLLAVGVLAAALLVLAVIRGAARLEERVTLQTSVDATAVSAATAYARALNISAASNHVLLAAGAGDAILKFFGVGLVAKTGKVAKVGGKAAVTSMTDLVMEFQDAWAGTGEVTGAAGMGLGALYVEASACASASRNGLEAVVIWNGEVGPDGVIPDLNIDRAGVADLAAWYTQGTPTGQGPDGGRWRIGFQRKVETTRYSYQPRGGGQRVIVAEEKGEKIWFRRRGKEASAYRVRQKAGKFVKRERVTKELTGVLDVPMPLIEREQVHTLLIIAFPAGTTRQTASARLVAAAEAANGEVFNIAYGDPSFEARLVEAPFNAGDAEVLLASLGSAGAWGSWAASSVASAVGRWLKSRVGFAGRG